MFSAPFSGCSRLVSTGPRLESRLECSPATGLVFPSPRWPWGYWQNPCLSRFRSCSCCSIIGLSIASDKEGPAALIREKAPFFLLTALSILVTLSAQGGGGAMRSSESVGLGLRDRERHGELCAVPRKSNLAERFGNPLPSSQYPRWGWHSLVGMGDRCFGCRSSPC